MSKNPFNSFIISWNNSFPLDKWFRKKYNLAFNSEAHRAANPIDIFFEWREEQLFEEFESNHTKDKEKQLQYEKGVWLEPRISEEQATMDAFDALDIGAINKSINSDGTGSESE